ncbi:MAG: hypothetical protein M1150_01505 [Patescibacteria group bacterium]|nr:hypothetical protein [Patescibacteria group bacterium]
MKITSQKSKVKSFRFLLFLLVFALFTLNFFSPAFAVSKVSTDNISVASGYSIKPILDKLNGPSALAFDDSGNIFLAESGFAEAGGAKVLKISPEGKAISTLTGFDAPINGLAFFKGKLYVSHRGKVSSVASDGTIQDIIKGLPSDGDFSNNQILIGTDKKLYITQGTVTNAGIVGEDNLVTGWLRENADLADVPCQSLSLNGVDFASNQNTTGAFVPFGSTTNEGQQVKGSKPCNGSIMRIDPTNPKEIEVIAWGLRNPVGIGTDSKGKIYFTEQGFDLRGRRLIKSSGDNFYALDGKWYGWPDYSAGQPISLSKFKLAGTFQPQFVLQDHPGKEMPPSPLAQFKPYSRVAGFAFSPEKFGFKDQIFVALSGSVKGLTDGSDKNSGFSVVRLDLKGRKISDFITNKKANNKSGPASTIGKSGIERPTDVKFSPNGEMYVADFGVLNVKDNTLKAKPESGVLWKVSKGASLFGFAVENPLTVEVGLGIIVAGGLILYFLFKKSPKNKPLKPRYFFFCWHN